MTTDKITQYLEQMAAKLGVAAEHVYGVLVRQQVAEGIAFTIGAVIAVFVLFRLGRWIYRNYEANKGDYMSDWGMILLFFLIFGGGGGVGAMVVGLIGVMQIINPEYYAIREIMDVIGGATR
ncbi:hypothetical protein [Brevibacillus sp. NL20B1]|uniref:hypothetical protein n=1 Tax=Brevibacillus sp. NL20B1 TaxID=2829799 RepID=UPI001BA31E21|nr:hypothetical protein [Brevibacillus sp. NL20B1]MBR8661185.1 hypothetical protein [Brevibacillus sp. NL20B1]